MVGGVASVEGFPEEDVEVCRFCRTAGEARRPPKPRQPADRRCPGLAAGPLRVKAFLLAYIYNVTLEEFNSDH